jgi:hypothetical protein
MSGYPYPQPSGLPTVQGLCDVLRSGHRNLEPDRESADAITAVYPDIGGCLRKEHGFASRAVTWAASGASASTSLPRLACRRPRD